MTGPAGHNTAVLFFSMNSYMSVGGARRECQQTFPSPVPAFVRRIKWKQRRQSGKMGSLTQRGQTQRLKYHLKKKISFKKEKKGERQNHNERGGVGTNRTHYCLLGY